MERELTIQDRLYLKEQVKMSWEEFESLIRQRDLDLRYPLEIKFQFQVLKKIQYGCRTIYELGEERFGQVWRWEGFGSYEFLSIGFRQEEIQDLWQRFQWIFQNVKRDLANTLHNYLGQAFSEIMIEILIPQKDSHLKYYEYGKKSVPVIDGRLDPTAVDVDERASMQPGETDIEILENRERTQ